MKMEMLSSQGSLRRHYPNRFDGYDLSRSKTNRHPSHINRSVLKPARARGATPHCLVLRGIVNAVRKGCQRPKRDHIARSSTALITALAKTSPTAAGASPG